jgi:lipoprotein-anchoring transpeptidase ErfK/SrfK
VQVGLDRLNFSPGCIDGKGGSQTVMAIQAWQIANGQPPTGSLTAEELAKFGNPDDAVALYTVTEEDIAAICPTPKTWKEKSEMARLGYYSVIELIAEQFHCKEDLLRSLNPGVDWKNVKAGTPVTVPDPQAGEVRPAKAARLQVNLKEKYIRAYDAQDRLIAHFPCSIAKDQEKRPSGDGKVVTAAKDPSYTYDPALFADEPESKLYNGKKLIIPPGPNNPVGTAWVSLNLPGYGMHGTPKPEEIGKTGSHGCFRLANWNAEKLLRMVDAGIPVKFEP